MKENVSEELKYVLSNMCNVIGIKFEDVNFDKEDWFEDYSWTMQQEADFIIWLTNILLKEDHIRESLLAHPEKDFAICLEAAQTFIALYGWNNELDNLEDLNENTNKNK